MRASRPPGRQLSKGAIFLRPEMEVCARTDKPLQDSDADRKGMSSY